MSDQPVEKYADAIKEIMAEDHLPSREALLKMLVINAYFDGMTDGIKEYYRLVVA